MIRIVSPGGFWRRAAALAVDWMWLFCLTGSLSLVLFGMALPGDGGMDARALGTWALHNLLPAVLIVAGWRLAGASPGKCLLELRIVDAHTGGQPTLARLALRYVGYFLSALPLGLGFLWALVNRDRRTFHDLLSGTRVVMVEEADLDLVPGTPV